MNALQMRWSRLLRLATMINFPSDVLDILIVAFLIYQLLRLSRSRSSGQIIKAVVFLLVMSYLANLLQLNTLSYIIGRVIEVGLIALVVVFQPELRRSMERLGSSSIRGLVGAKGHVGDSAKTVEETVDACKSMSKQKIGALIVFEREINLEEYFKTGTVLDAEVSSELYKNLFFPKAALHDGAVVVRQDRIAAGACVLPLTENPNLSRDLGTRHRAAIGISERTDAVVVVVSEETGVISVVIGGIIQRFLTPEKLKKILIVELVEEEITSAHQRILGNLIRRNKETGTAELEVADSHEESHEEEQ